MSEVLVRQAWHVAIHSSLMWQGPFIAKTLLLLRRLLITVDKQAGGGPPPAPNNPSIRTKRDLSDTLPPGKFWLAPVLQKFPSSSKISKAVKENTACRSENFNYVIDEDRNLTVIPSGDTDLKAASFFCFLFFNSTCAGFWKRPFCNQQCKLFNK